MQRAARIRNPIAMLTGGEPDARQPVYNAPGLFRWLRINRTLPHNRGPVDFSRLTEQMDAVQWRPRACMTSERAARRTDYARRTEAMLLAFAREMQSRESDDSGTPSSLSSEDEQEQAAQQFPDWYNQHPQQRNEPANPSLSESDMSDEEEEEAENESYVEFRRWASNQTRIPQNIRHIHGVPLWLNDYWHHHPYTDRDNRAEITRPNQDFIRNSPPATSNWETFRWNMANYLNHAEHVMQIIDYWLAHPLERGRDTRDTVTIFFQYMVQHAQNRNEIAHLLARQRAEFQIHASRMPASDD